MKFLSTILGKKVPAAVVLIRLTVGGIFLSEGIQKFLYPYTVGVGRFEKIGIPLPEFTAPFTAIFEIGCGLLVLLGLLTQPAAVPLMIVMVVAFLSTKLPILLGDAYGVSP